MGNDRQRPLLLAACAGLLAGLALPPLGALPLLWLSLAALWLLAGSPAIAAFPAGLVWGAAAVLVSHRWLLWLHPLDWIGVPGPLSLPLCVLLLLLLGLCGGLLVGGWLVLVRRLDPASPAGAGLAMGRVASRIRDRSVRGALVALIVIVPIAALPELAWGAGGRLQATTYPADWTGVRDVLETDERPGDVLVLPWAAFRQFAWNGNRTVLDPAPRWLPRTSVVADSLAVDTPDGMVVLEGEDARGREIERALAADAPLAPVLPGLGIGWVLVEVGQPPGLGPRVLDGLTLVREGPDLILYAVPGPVASLAAPAYAPWVMAADLTVATLLALGALLALGTALRARHRRDEGVASERLVR